ncbi:MAG: phosphatase PAP2 family protein, partial [Actinomycetes bacterium]
MPSRRESRERSDRALQLRLLLGGSAAFLVAVPFTLLLLLVVSEWEPLARLDADVADGLNEQARSHDWLVTGLEVGEVALDPWAYRLVVLGVVVWLWRRGVRRLALWATVTTVLGGLLT